MGVLVVGKTSLQQLLAQWSKVYPTQPCRYDQCAYYIVDDVNLFGRIVQQSILYEKKIASNLGLVTVLVSDVGEVDGLSVRGSVLVGTLNFDGGVFLKKQPNSNHFCLY